MREIAEMGTPKLLLCSVCFRSIRHCWPRGLQRPMRRTRIKPCQHPRFVPLLASFLSNQVAVLSAGQYGGASTTYCIPFSNQAAFACNVLCFRLGRM